jgi:hypothetical protein
VEPEPLDLADATAAALLVEELGINTRFGTRRQ